jgi:hypothetical protein
MNAAGLAQARSDYWYVPARLVRTNALEPSLTWDDLRLTLDLPDEARWQEKAVGSGYRSLELDQFHCGLLHGTAEDRLHGLASVVFWGYASGTDGKFRVPRALNRVQWLIRGNKRFAPQLKTEILEYLDKGLQCAAVGDLSGALSSLMNIKFLGMSFASKVVAFANPDQAVVYDRKIEEILRNDQNETLRQIAVDVRRSDISYRPVQCSSYALWCAFCSRVAQELEETGHHWQDWDRKSITSWRAVDVERAYFANAKPKTRSPP